MIQVKGKRVIVLLMLASLAFSFAGSGSADDIFGNCCYSEGWECNPYEEWVNGYYAYRRGECPPQYAPSSSTSEDTDGQGESDNCCFGPGWDCQMDEQWVMGYNAYSNNQCHLSLYEYATGGSGQSQSESYQPVASSPAPEPEPPSVEERIAEGIQQREELAVCDCAGIGVIRG